MTTLPLSVTPEARAELRRKRGERKREMRYLADSMRVTIADIEFSLRKFRGSVTKAAEFLGTEPAVLRRKIGMTPALRSVCKQIVQEKVDEAEYKLAEQVEQGYFPAIALTLKTLGKDRGYTESTKVEHEISEKGIRDAAALIEAMKRGMASETVVESDIVEIKEADWHTKEPLLLTS